jgi:hypothetical protein
LVIFKKSGCRLSFFNFIKVFAAKKVRNKGKKTRLRTMTAAYGDPTGCAHDLCIQGLIPLTLPARIFLLVTHQAFPGNPTTHTETAPILLIITIKQIKV